MRETWRECESGKEKDDTESTEEHDMRMGDTRYKRRMTQI